MRDTVRIVIPSECPDVVGPFLERVTRRYGGVTSWPGTGVWHDPDGEIVADEITVVEISVVGYGPKDEDFFDGLAEQIAVELDQKTVFVSRRTEDSRLVPHPGKQGQDGSAGE